MEMNRCSAVQWFAVALTVCATSSLFAQEYSIAQASIITCSGKFTDTGGSTNYYGPNENFTSTICSGSATTSHVNLIFRSISLESNDILCFYDGNSTNAPLLGCNADYPTSESFLVRASANNQSGCLTVTFSSNAITQSNGWESDIFCTQPCQKIIAELAGTSPLADASGYIDICPGDEVTFTGKGQYPENGTLYIHSDATSSFNWDFGDGETASGKTVTHRFERPGGYKVQLFVKDERGCSSSNLIGQSVRVAPPLLIRFSDNIPKSICTGDSLHINSALGSNGSMLQVTPVEATFTAGGVLADSVGIPDGTGLVYETSIKVADFGQGQTLDDINDLLGICVNMEHSFMGDLEIKLTCPSGNTVTLHEFSNFSGGNLALGEPALDDDAPGQVPIPGKGYDYCWSPTATNGTWLEYNNQHPSAIKLPAGTYSSYDDLSNLLGCSLNGDWTISIQDYWGVDNGVIFSWSLEMDTDILPDLEKFTPSITNYYWGTHPDIFLNTKDSIKATSPFAGNAHYTFHIEDDFGCEIDTFVAITYLPPHDPACHDCAANGIAAMPDTIICENTVLQLGATYFGPSSTEVTYRSESNQLISNENHPNSTPFASSIAVNGLHPDQATSATVQAVCVQIAHERMDDLDVFLQMPDGTRLELSTDNGGTGKGYDLCFTPTAPNNIASAPTNASTAITGDWLPEGNWNTLQNKNVNGTWSLLVSDDTDNNLSGVVESWRIVFSNENPIEYEWRADPSLSCTDCAAPTAMPTNYSTDYQVTVTDGFGCTYAEDKTVILDPCLPCKLDISLDELQAATCSGTNDGHAIFSTTSVNYPIQYVLDDSIHQTDNPIFNNLAFGKHALYMKVATDCDTTFLFFIDTLRQVRLLLDSVNVRCFGGSTGSATALLFNATGNVSYAWSDARTQTSPTASNLPFGKYYVTATDAVGCMAVDSVSITQPDSLVVTLVTTPISCYDSENGALEAKPSGGSPPYSYGWSLTGAPNNRRIDNLPEGNYALTLTDSRGCTAFANASLLAPKPLVLEMHQRPVSCKGGSDGQASVLAAGGISPYTFLWNDADKQSTDTAFLLAAGPLSVLVQDSNYCTQSATVEVTEPSDSLQFVLQQTKIACSATNDNAIEANVTGGTAGYNYLWSNGATAANVTGLGVGTYQLTVTDARQCVFSDSIALVEHPAIIAELDTVAASCHGKYDGAANVLNVEGGIGNGILSEYRYAWSTLPQQNWPNATYLQGGQSYQVSITDKAGCQGVFTVSIPQPDILRLETGSMANGCNGDSTYVFAQALGGTLPYTLAWSNGLTSDTLYNMAVGSYQVSVTDANNCTATSSVTLVGLANIQIQLSPTHNLCYGQAAGSIASTVSGGRPPYSYNWSNGNDGPNVQDLPNGNYLLTVTDGQGCSNIAATNINSPSELSASVFVERPTCAGGRDGSLTINAFGGAAPYQYGINGGAFASNSLWQYIGAGDYVVYIKDANGCADTLEQVVIPDKEPLNLTINDGTEILEIPYGQAATLTANVGGPADAFTYLWRTLNSSMDSILLCKTCPSSATTPLYQDANVLLQITDSDGCKADASILLNVVAETYLFVPNAFTPNGDGFNDKLVVHGKEGIKILAFEVFDRWGEKVFRADDFMVNDASFGWDGTFKGKPLQSGVYVWGLVVEYANGLREKKQGSTQLLRND
jgi:gliding motility-associated-like protein